MEDHFRRSFEFKLDSFDEEKREVMLSFSSETEEVERWFGIEILSHKRTAPDLSRLRNVGSLLFGHTDEIIGPIKRVQINESAGRGEALVGFDETPEGNKRMLQVKNKSLRGVSVDYRIKSMRELAPGEEYQLGSKTIRGRKDVPVMVAEKWEPVEISLLPKPYDTSVGVGRSLSRSLEGIEIIKHQEEGLKVSDENKVLDQTQMRAIIKETITAELKNIVPEIVTQTKAAIAEESKPRMRIDVETFRDLTNRASAISPQAMNSVTNLALEGKTEPEILRFLNDEMVKTSDLTNVTINEGDGTGRTTTQGSSNQEFRTFKDVDDAQFWNTLKNPASYSYN